MILDVQHLRMVEAIHEVGTLTGASRRLSMSQPALSRALAKLEDRIGSRLFRRHPRGMTLTPEGRRVLESAERVLGELARAEDDVKLLAEGAVGSLRVTTECYMCYHWLPGVARAFGARFPRVEVQLVPEATPDPYGALERSAVDVALVYSTPPNTRSVTREEIFQDELVALVPSAHPLAGEPHLAPEAFEAETLLCHYAEPGRGALERDFFEPAGAWPKRTMEMLVTPAVIEMARAGYGIAVVPEWILPAQASLSGLVARPLGEGGLSRTWHAACASTRSDEPALASLVETLREQLRVGEAAGDGTPEPRVRLA